MNSIVSTRPFKKPLILVITAAFLAYASLIPLPKLLSEPLRNHLGVVALVIASLVSLAMLCLMGKRKSAFWAVRGVLAVWLVVAIVAFYDRCREAGHVAPSPTAPNETLNACMLGVAAVLMAVLFVAHGFGRASRRYYEIGSRT